MSSRRLYITAARQRESSPLNSDDFRNHFLAFCAQHAREFSNLEPSRYRLIDLDDIVRTGPPAEILLYVGVAPLEGKTFTERVKDAARLDDHIDEVEVRKRTTAPRNGRVSIAGLLR